MWQSAFTKFAIQEVPALNIEANKYQR